VAAPRWCHDMPTSPDFQYPRRYNSLRLLGFDYADASALFFVTVDTDLLRPAFGDITLVKSVLAALLHSQTEARIRIQAYTLMPDHLRLLAGVREACKNLSTALGAFKSYTTQLYWKRSNQIVEEKRVALPPRSVQNSERSEAAPLLAAFMEWRFEGDDRIHRA
jgi:REP element-mobilizing transposase RayT